jgi:hypothetical protein
MSWAWNNDYKDLGQVEAFYPAYLAVYEQLRAADGYPFNADFKGRIPGIEGPREDTAIYLLQKLRSIRDMEAKVTGHRAAGWRDVDLAELDGGPVRFAGVAEYGWYMGGDGFQSWENARLTRHDSSVWVLPGRNRTRGHLVAGKLLVKTAEG